MKGLTDYFQSAELVKAGVPRETADFFFQKDSEYLNAKKRYEPTFPYMPCWSIAALWEYVYEHNGDIVFTFETDQDLDELVQGLVNAACIARKREDE